MTDSTDDALHFIAATVAGIEDNVGNAAPDGYPYTETVWPEIVQLANRHGLGPLLLARVQDEPIGPGDRSVLAPLVSARTEAAVHYLVATEAREQVQRTLEDADVPCVWLKGIALVETVYSSPEQRPMVDIDVLVPYAQRERALDVVRSAGFDMAAPQLFDGREGIKHHYYLASTQYDPVRVELHFRLLGSMDRILTVEDQRWFWHHSTEIESRNGERMSILDAEAHLLYLCAHAMIQHGEADFRLLRLYDLDRLLTASPGFDWGEVLDTAVQLRWTYPVERALTLMHDYFNTPLPDGLLCELASRRPSAERTEHAQRRQSHRTKTQVVADNLAAMDWPARLYVAARIVAPPPRYMRWRYGLNSNLELPGAYLQRMGRMASDALRTARRKRLG